MKRSIACQIFFERTVAELVPCPVKHTEENQNSSPEKCRSKIRHFVRDDLVIVFAGRVGHTMIHPFINMMQSENSHQKKNNQHDRPHRKITADGLIHALIHNSIRCFCCVFFRHVKSGAKPEGKEKENIYEKICPYTLNGNMAYHRIHKGKK